MSVEPQRSLGRRQRAILETMYANGGIWPPHWRTTSNHAHIFASLLRRGLIRRAWIGKNYTYRVTQPSP